MSNDSSPDIGTIIDQNANRTLAPKAVLSQVLLMTAFSAITIVVFNILRPRNKATVIYEPKVKYHVGNQKPPPISPSVFGWVSPLVRCKEADLVDKIGLDAITYLRFLRLSRWLFSAVALLVCAVLVPINITFNLKQVTAANQPDILTMMTIRNVTGNLLFAHITVMWGVTGLVLGFVYIHWKNMVRLRQAWFRSPEYQESFYARTLLVLRVPRSLQSDEGIRATFQSVQVPYPTTSVHIGRKVGRLPELIEYHNNTVRELEEVLVRYLKGGKIRSTRPTITLGGFLGFGGQKKDAIDFYTAKLKRTEAAVEEYRIQIDSRKPENYGFASMAAVPYAHIVANMLKNKKPKGTTVTLAPNPKDIIWSNITKSPADVARLKMTGFIILAVICFFNTVPLFVISILANLTAIASFVPFLQSWANDSPTFFAVVSGVLPPAVSALFGYFLPIIMRKTSKYQGAHTHSRLDRAVVARYFAFLVISQLVIFTLIGVIFHAVEEIIIQIGQHNNFQQILNNLDKLPGTINRTYIDQSSYWLTFFPLRGFLAIFDLAQILKLAWTSFRTRVFGRTPRDIRDWTQPPDFEYAIYYSNILFMICVGLIFAPLAPLVAVAAAVVLWVSSWVYKYQLMFVFVSKVETGGRLWNPVINRLLASCVLMQLLMTLTMGLQMGWGTYHWVATVPPIFVVFFFKAYLKRTFDRHFRYYVPSDEELRRAKIHSERADHKGNRLEKRFGHPALHSELFTPMLHAKMMPLLREVYSGKISNDKAVLGEYGGQKMETQIMPGGIRIAGIDQNDLEYDPALYQRDRGELDWDQRSMASTAALNDFSDGASLQPAKSQYYANGRASPAPSGRGVPAGYDRYMAQGPTGPQNDIELSRLDSDQQPLLYAPGSQGYFDPRGNPSSSSITLNGTPPLPQYPPSQQGSPGEGYRQAPVHRPYPSRQMTSYTSEVDLTYNAGHQQRPSENYDQAPGQRSYTPTRPPSDSSNNVAGRGAYGRGL
ncbi:hypothetical protein JAAARDRAFT_134456 [Jaapia argillacea MUCL 33604]|uniref:DUF221-domain-containing protein n=1 Tax=Jaapia argillacea MUCL 33604 TaxID=933084 RepID=A0A067PK17_9AGAM|nr:hypothetical protein JAAARDRAFT_134456 [Jaapia argillacea MUCL 33604]